MYVFCFLKRWRSRVIEACEFQLSHAQAQDAVYQSLNTAYLTEQLKDHSLQSFHVNSNSEDKETYLKRPDLGRQLSEHSKQILLGGIAG